VEQIQELFVVRTNLCQILRESAREVFYDGDNLSNIIEILF
jgi:hypothetical protein